MAAVVERGDLVKIATNLGAKGKAAPEWLDDDPAYRAAYNEAAGVATPAAAPTPSAPAKKAPAKAPTKAPARKPAATRPAQEATPPAVPGPPADGYLARSMSPSAAADRLGAGKLTRAGDGGGLLLAFVLYPIGLATVKYGPTGPLVWFRAKWLNQPTEPTATHNAPQSPRTSTPTRRVPR